jgi:hypothetical protein
MSRSMKQRKYRFCIDTSAKKKKDCSAVCRQYVVGLYVLRCFRDYDAKAQLHNF